MKWHGKQVEVLGRLHQVVTVRCEGIILQIPESQLIPDTGHQKSGVCELCGYNKAAFRDLKSVRSRPKVWLNVCDCCSRIFCMGFREALSGISKREQLWNSWRQHVTDNSSTDPV